MKRYDENGWVVIGGEWVRYEDVAKLEAAARLAIDALSRCYDVTEWPANGSTAADKALAELRKALE